MTTAPLSPAQIDYVTVFHRRLAVLLGRRHPSDLADELTQQEVLRLCEQVGRVMAAFPDPVTYARIRATGRHALVTHLRADDVQAGRGARRGRAVLDGESSPRSIDDRPGRAADAGTLFERAARRLPFMIDHEAERSEHMRRLHTVLSSLEPRERTVLYLVDGQGYTVTAAAGIMGVARETAARARSSARRKLALID